MNDKWLLLVEDNPNDETLTLLALKQAKITNRVDVVRDGEEALDFLFCKVPYVNRDPSLLPQLVLLDLKLPKIDGLDVLKKFEGMT